jgi:putative two-component system response regulator
LIQVFFMKLAYSVGIVARPGAGSADPLPLLTSLLTQKDRHTADHCTRVMWYAGRIAQAMDLPEQEVAVVRHASLVHDVGKVRIPDEVLSFPGTLDEDAMELVRSHALRGEEILQRFPGHHMQTVAALAGAHHERFDGTGYPRRLFGCNIPLGARIIAVCDAFDAMTAGRCYRPAWSYGRAVEELIACSGTQFDPEVVALFISISDERIFRISS